MNDVEKIIEAFTKITEKVSEVAPDAFNLLVKAERYEHIVLCGAFVVLAIFCFSGAVLLIKADIKRDSERAEVDRLYNVYLELEYGSEKDNARREWAEKRIHFNSKNTDTNSNASLVVFSLITGILLIALAFDAFGGVLYPEVSAAKTIIKTIRCN